MEDYDLKKVVLATGAIERPIIFNNNDRPGIMLSNSARKYLNKFGVAVGKNLVFFTNNDSAHETAIDYSQKGVNIQAIVDVRSEANGHFPKKAKEIGITILNGYEIINTTGRLRVKEVKLKKLSSNYRDEYKSSITIKCDTICVSGGWNPTVHLFTQSKGKLNYRDFDGFIPEEAFQNTLCVGSCNGDYSLHKILELIPKKLIIF